MVVQNNFMNMYIAATRIGISKHALNQVTGTIFVHPGKRREVKDRNGVNVGLQMRLMKANREIPGISKRLDNGWYLSNDAVDIICDYLDKFPKLCEVLASNSRNIFEEDVCPEVDCEEGSYLAQMAAFIKNAPHISIPQRLVGSEYVEPHVAKAIEEAVDAAKRVGSYKTAQLQIKLHLLYLPSVSGPMSGCPDPGTTFRLFDRVTIATKTLPIPIGSRGTIVGISTETDENPLKMENKDVKTYLYQVLFDEKVPNGDDYYMDIGKERVQTVFQEALINISYGRCKYRDRTKFYRMFNHLSFSIPIKIEIFLPQIRFESLYVVLH